MHLAFINRVGMGSVGVFDLVRTSAPDGCNEREGQRRMSNDKTTPKNLKVGDRILATLDDGVLNVTSRKRGSIVVEIVRPPEIVDAPEEGKRRGWQLDTSDGVIGFVSGVAGVLLASTDDIAKATRARRMAVDAERARDQAQMLLGGILHDDAGSHEAPKPEPKQRETRKAAPVSEVAAATNGKPLPSSVLPVPTTTAAATNYRYMARSASTESARVFWSRLADAAAGA